MQEGKRYYYVTFLTKAKGERDIISDIIAIDGFMCKETAEEFARIKLEVFEAKLVSFTELKTDEEFKAFTGKTVEEHFAIKKEEQPTE